MAETKETVLIVDDITSIRMAISDYLSSTYHVLTARDGNEALSVLESGRVDFLLSDIRMPGMSGLDLITTTQKRWPEVKYALMTAYNINDYIHYAREHRIYNIIPKSTFLDLNFIRIMLHKLLTGRIFGIDNYLPRLRTENLSIAKLHKIHRNTDDAAEALFSPDTNYLFQVETHGEKDAGCDAISDILCRNGAPSIFRQITEELASNAMTHGHGKMQLGFGLSDETVFLSVTDHSGTLDRDEILLRLERNVTLDENGLPYALSDPRGRGLFISRENTDQLIFNIAPGKCTEVIAFINAGESVRTRAVSIYQSDRDVFE